MYKSQVYVIFFVRLFITGFEQWREDLKYVLKKAGAYNKESVFIMSESHLNQPNFLEDLDVLLSTGTVPNIYSFDEVQEILQVCS